MNLHLGGAFRVGRLPDQKRRHVIHEPLVQVVAGHDDQDVGLRRRHLPPHAVVVLCRLGDDRVRIGVLDQPREKRVMGNADNFNEFCHETTSGWDSTGPSNSAYTGLYRTPARLVKIARISEPSQQ